ncbi:hypothetical protein ACVIGB_000119 [Bradyrhizobium sp. USDA 4341]
MSANIRLETHPGYYLHDARGCIVGISEIGVAAEPERETVTGGGLVDLPDDDRAPSIAVLHAPSMPQRFLSVEITGGGVFMVRTDGARCSILCDPLVAEEVARRGSMLVKEAGDHHKDCLIYEIAIVAPEYENSMRM